LRSHFGLITEEGGLVAFVDLAFHVGWHNAFLNVLEFFTDRVGNVGLAGHATVKELSRIGVVLRSGVRHLVLEELLLRMLESRVLAEVLWDACHRVLAVASVT